MSSEKKSSPKIYQTLNEFILETFPKAESETKYGGILFSMPEKEHFCGIFSYKNHVSIEFSFGYKMKDPEKILAGSGKFRRHIKLDPSKNVDWSTLKKYLKEAAKLAN